MTKDQTNCACTSTTHCVCSCTCDTKALLKTAGGDYWYMWDYCECGGAVRYRPLNDRAGAALETLARVLNGDLVINDDPDCGWGLADDTKITLVAGRSYEP